VEFNLHKPYIDAIFLAPKNARKAKKVLAVHGYRSRGIQSGYDGAFLPLQDTLKESGIQFDVPDFDKSKETSYAQWKQTLDTLDIQSYDTILATSFGCPIIMQYLCENKIQLPRLIFVAPSGCVGNEYLEKVLPELTEDVVQIRSLIDEIVIIHSRDDDSTSAPFSYGVALHEKIGGVFLPVNGFKHKF
jgi:predicted alpha/beta hydrolase family esterase